MKLCPHLVALCMTSGLALTPTIANAQLLGLTANLPTIDSPGAGMIDYNASTGIVTISGDPVTLFSTNPFIFGEILGTGVDDVKYINIQFQVDGSGTVVPGDTSVPDLVVTGSVDTNGDGTADFSGTLLTAEVTQFGFLDGASGTADNFDVRLNNIGGNLAYLYTGQDLAIIVTSDASAEYTTPFAGGFAADWKAPAKSSIGSTAPISGGGCHLKLVAKCSVDGGPFKDKCRIKVTRSPEHWERDQFSHSGNIFHKSKYGMHGDAVPAWAANYPSTSVTFNYTVTNDGDNPVSDILIEDSFDTSLPVYPTSLAVGASFTTSRTIDLNEGIENDVNVMASYGGQMCGASDVVVIKDKLRDRRPHDDDDYKDKGNR